MADRFLRTVAISAGLAGVLALTITLVAAQSASSPNPADSTSTPKTTDQVYKNIKVLKGIPASQLIPAMQFITASLGVKCDHCHAEGHFDSDEKKPKETARKMMTMMFAINKDNFDDKRKVTCFTCHRGSVHPMAIPDLNAPAPMVAMAASLTAPPPDQSTLPAGADLIDKYVQAIGGPGAVEKITSRVEKGITSGFGHSFPTEAFFKGSNQSAVITHFPNGENAAILNEQHGWMAFPGRPVRPLEGADLEAAEMDSDLQLPLHLKSMFHEFKAAPPQKIGEQNAFEAIGLNPGQPPVELYFDQQSGLLLRLVRYAESPLGLYPTQIDYADYRDEQGLKIPFKITTLHPGSSSTFQIEQVEQNVAIDSARFAPPDMASPPAK